MRSLTGHHDNATFNYPLRVEVARQWAAGRLPLWNPYNLAGAPLLADITSAALYPGNLPFLLEPDGTRYRALDRVAALHFILAAIFMYVFARALPLGRPAAALAGLVYAGNGTLLFLASRWIQTQNSAVWLPLVLAAVHRAAERRRFWLWIAIGAGAVAMQILSGYPQYVFYTGLLAGAYALMLALGRSGKGWRPLLALVAMYALGAALAGVQLVPTLELVALSRRGGVVSLGEFLQLAASPNILLGLANPRGVVSPTGIPVPGAAFVGTLALVLAIEGARSARRTRLFLSVTLVVAFLLAVGPATPVGWLSYQIPGLNVFRYPFKHLLEVTFCLAALAGCGAQSLLDRRRGATACVAIAGSIVVCWLTLGMPSGSRHWSGTVAVAGTVGFVLLALADRRRTAVGLALVSVWLGLAGNRDAPFTLLRSNERRAEPPSMVSALAARQPTLLGPRYVAAIFPMGFRLASEPLLALDYPTEFRVPAVHGTSPFLWRPLGAALGMDDNGIFHPGIFQNSRDQTLNVLGAQYVGSAGGPLTKVVIQDEAGASVAERRRSLPVIRFVDRAICMEQAAMLQELQRRTFDFATVALLDCAARPDVPALDPAQMRAKMMLVENAPGRFRLQVRLGTGRPGVLIVSQSDIPGWRARIDGQPVPIYRAYGLVQGLVVPAGLHDVELEYRPASVILGAEISLAAVVAMLGVAVLAVRAGRRRDPAAGPCAPSSGIPPADA